MGNQKAVLRAARQNAQFCSHGNIHEIFALVRTCSFSRKQRWQVTSSAGLTGSPHDMVVIHRAVNKFGPLDDNED